MWSKHKRQREGSEQNCSFICPVVCEWALKGFIDREIKRNLHFIKALTPGLQLVIGNAETGSRIAR
jgi:hypothetical protein